MPATKLSEMEQNIARAIGYFYLEKQGSGPFEDKWTPYNAACKELRELGLTQIHYIPGGRKKTLFRKEIKPSIVVHVARPGILIGSKGANLDALEQYLADIHIVPERIRVKIVEERVAIDVASLFVHGIVLIFFQLGYA